MLYFYLNCQFKNADNIDKALWVTDIIITLMKLLYSGNVII